MAQERLTESKKVYIQVLFLPFSLQNNLFGILMMFLFGKFLLSMFISGDPAQAEQVLGIAWHYLSIMASCLCILVFSLRLIVLHFRDLGNTMLPMSERCLWNFLYVSVLLSCFRSLSDRMAFFMRESCCIDTELRFAFLLSVLTSVPRKFM